MNSSVLHQQIVVLPRPKSIIFDLDDTLLDTSGLLIPLVGTDAYFHSIKQPLPTISGAKENLEVLRRNHYSLFLVTQGKESIQRQKVASLGITSFFDEIVFVTPPSTDTREEGPKYEAFLQLLSKYRLSAETTLSVGNRPKFDLRPMKALHGQTCWYRYGEHMDELSNHPLDKPDFVVSSHAELLAACNLI